MKPTSEMRARIRELVSPPRDDFDRAVLCVLDDELSHEQYCRLSRAFGQVANLSINSPDYAINEWLKEKIAQSAQ